MTICLKQGAIEVRSIRVEDLKPLWEISYGPQADLLWTEFDGPYFKDPILSWADFSQGFGKASIDNPHRSIVLYQNELVGMLSAYWEDGALKQWLEFGIVIYGSKGWNKGIGYRASRLWLEYLFNLYPHLQRIGFTTWSGNLGMMGLGEKLKMKQEARIRKVRFTKNQYFDSIKYGILREEFEVI